MYDENFTLDEQKGIVEDFFNIDDYASKDINGLTIVNWKLKSVPSPVHPKFSPGDKVEYKNKKITKKQGTVVTSLYGGYSQYVDIAWDNSDMNVYKEGRIIRGITEYKGNLNIKDKKYPIAHLEGV